MTCRGLKNANKSADCNIFMYLKISPQVCSLSRYYARGMHIIRNTIYLYWCRGEKTRNE